MNKRYGTDNATGEGISQPERKGLLASIFQAMQNEEQPKREDGYGKSL